MTARRVTVSPDGRELDDLLIGPLGLLGLAGAPGSGKSTLGACLGRRVLPMDGFHYADSELRRRGLADRLGAPETFDAEGYAVLLARVHRGEEVVAPMFDRIQEQPIAGAIHVPAGVAAGTEGNYLLLDEPRWRAVRRELDQVWHLHVEEAVRRHRLLARHVAFGKSLAEAEAWVRRVDDPNARLVEAAADRADVVIDLTAWRGALRRTPLE